MTIREALNNTFNNAHNLKPLGHDFSKWDEIKNRLLDQANATIDKIITEKVEMAVRAREDDLPKPLELLELIELRLDGCEARLGTTEWIEMIVDLVHTRNMRRKE